MLDTASKGKDKNANKTWSFLADGWYSKAMGGMEHFDYDEKGSMVMPDVKAPKSLPDFLSKGNASDFYKLPAKFQVKALLRTCGQVELQINAEDAGSNAKAVVYYGQEDALTFSERWQGSKDVGDLGRGLTVVTLAGLKPATQYYARVLLTNDQGKIWSLDTLKFTTKNMND